jgi:hypothetical protein
MTEPTQHAEYALVGGCVCDDPENYCGGADIDPDEPGYCAACAALDGEEHCLLCPFECCAALRADVDDRLLNDGLGGDDG